MAEIQAITFNHFQSVIQLAAGLSAAYLSIPDLTRGAENIYRRSRADLDKKEARYRKYAQETTTNLSKENISSEDRSSLRNLEVKGRIWLHDRERADREFEQLQESSANTAVSIAQLSCVTLILSVFMLFIGSHPSPFYIDTITTNNALAANDAFFNFISALCSLLFIPQMLAIFGMWNAQRKARKIRDRLYERLDDLIDAILGISADK